MATLKELAEIETRINKLLAKKAKYEAASKALAEARKVLSNGHPTMECYERNENVEIPNDQIQAWYQLEGRGESIGDILAEISDELFSLGYYDKKSA